MEKTKQSQKSLARRLMYWKRSAGNLFRMGHCAPAVMQTLLDVPFKQGMAGENERRDAQASAIPVLNGAMTSGATGLAKWAARDRSWPARDV
jgi:hypothetical protein